MFHQLKAFNAAIGRVQFAKIVINTALLLYESGQYTGSFLDKDKIVWGFFIIKWEMMLVLYLQL